MILPAALIRMDKREKFRSAHFEWNHRSFNTMNGGALLPSFFPFRRRCSHLEVHPNSGRRFPGAPSARSRAAAARLRAGHRRGGGVPAAKRRRRRRSPGFGFARSRQGHARRKSRAGHGSSGDCIRRWAKHGRARRHGPATGSRRFAAAGRSRRRAVGGGQDRRGRCARPGVHGRAAAGPSGCFASFGCAEAKCGHEIGRPGAAEARGDGGQPVAFIRRRSTRRRAGRRHHVHCR